MQKYFVVLFLLITVFTGKHLLSDFGYQAHIILSSGYFPNNQLIDAPVKDMKGTVKIYLNNGKTIYSDGRYFNFRMTDLY